MVKSKKIRIAMIGLGDIAQKAYLPIVANHKEITPVLCTRNKYILKELAAQYRIDETYANIDELIKHKPDAAMVHSSTASHYVIISKLLHAGISTFVDKPLCYSINESEELLNLATQKGVLIYLGFNRRFAPLINQFYNQQNPIQIFWQKNRVNLPGSPRVFIFDDFIHVVDSLRYLGNGIVENLQVFSKVKNKNLESIHVQWQQGETLLNGTMNRISGVTQEYMEYYTNGNKWKIEELTSGVHYKNERKISLNFNNWESTLYKRGFVNLFEDWLTTLKIDKFNSNQIQDIWETHNLCETIVVEILKKNKQMTY